VQTDFSGLS